MPSSSAPHTLAIHDVRCDAGDGEAGRYGRSRLLREANHHVFPAHSFDLVITDPPYGKNLRLQHQGHEKADWDDKFPAGVLAATIDEKFFALARLATYVFCEWENIWDHEKRPLLPKPTSVITWHKTKSGAAGNCGRAHIRDSELILFYPGPTLKHFTHRPRSVIRHRPDRARLHESPKPVGLIKELMKAYEGQFDSVLDLYMGSGSTAEAAKQLSKKLGKQIHFIGFEANEGKWRRAMKRFSDIVR